MIYRKVSCPHCGNDIIVNNDRKETKCRWCRRIVGVKFTGKGRKSICNVEALDFDEPCNTSKFKPKENINYEKWREKDVYGY